jgi:hypothetical protein
MYHLKVKTKLKETKIPLVNRFWIFLRRYIPENFSEY